MRIVAFITDGPTVRDTLAQPGEPTAPPRIAPARGPPLWVAAGAEHDPAADPLLQCAPAFEFDQRIAWQPPPSPRADACPGAGSCLQPPAWPRAAAQASPPARKCHDKRADQPVAAENARLTRPAGSPPLGLVRLK